MNKYDKALRFFSGLSAGIPIQQLAMGKTMEEVMSLWEVATECITKSYCEQRLVKVEVESNDLREV